MRRFFVHQEDIREGRTKLVGGEAYHALQVLRLKKGDRVLLVDGQGCEYSARLTAVGPGWAELNVETRQPALAEPLLNLTIGLALLKSDRMDLVVQKGTELGLKRLVPVKTARCTVRLDQAGGDKRLDRWRRIAKEAMKQCRRGLPLDVRPVMDLKEFLSGSIENDLKIMLYEGLAGTGAGEWRSLLRREPKPRSVAALIGPEGGLTQEEVEEARRAGFEAMGLGPRILRSETAALALTAVLGFELGDLF